jgi:methylphosphotriester-DNA--protein-cysteine methyltransferase
MVSERQAPRFDHASMPLSAAKRAFKLEAWNGIFAMIAGANAEEFRPSRKCEPRVHGSKQHGEPLLWHTIAAIRP